MPIRPKLAICVLLVACILSACTASNTPPSGDQTFSPNDLTAIASEVEIATHVAGATPATVTATSSAPQSTTPPEPHGVLNQNMPPSASWVNPPVGAVGILGLGTLDVDLSPSGRYLVVHTSLGVNLYDLNTLSLVWPHSEPDAPIHWLPGGDTLALGKRIVNIVTGETIRAVVSGWGAWSPDASVYATPGMESSVILYDNFTGAKLYDLPLPESMEQPPYGISWSIYPVFSPDGKWIAGSYDWSGGDVGGTSNIVPVWNVQTGQRHVVLSAGKAVNRLVWSPDSRLLAMQTVYSDSSYDIAEVSTGEIVQQGQSGDIAWSPDGSRYATEGDIRDTRSFEEVTDLLKVTNNFVWSTDGQYVAGTFGNEIIVYDAVTGKDIYHLNGYAVPIGFSSDATKLVVQHDNALTVWAINSPGLQQPVLALVGTGPINAFDWLSDDQLVSGSGYYGGLAVTRWDAASGSALQVLHEGDLQADPYGGIVSLDKSPDGSGFLLASSRGSARRFNISDNKITIFKTGTTARFNVDGSLIATTFGFYEGELGDSIQIWDSVSGNSTQSLSDNGNGFPAIDWSPVGDLLAAASVPPDYWSRTYHYDAVPVEIPIWDAKTGEVVSKLKMGDVKGVIYSLAWSPDGRKIAAGFAHDSVVVWDVESGELYRYLTGNIDKHIEMAYVDLGWSPDSKLIAAAYGKNPVYRECNGCGYGTPGLALVWDVETGLLIGEIDNHKKEVQAVAFSPDGQTLATASLDGTIILWDASTWLK